MRASCGWWLTLVPLAAACSSPSPSQLKTRYDGTLAISTDGKFLYTANVDADTMTVVDTSAKTVVATVAVGRQPSRIAIGADDTIYVSNRGDRSVSVIQRGDWSDTTTLQVGADPTGLAVSADGRALYVVSSGSGTLDAFDLRQPGFAQLWEANLGESPRGVAVLPNFQLWVTHFKTAMVDRIDSSSGDLLGSTSAAVGVDPLSAGATVGPLAASLTFRPVGLDSILVSPDGTQAYLAHSRDRNGVLGAAPAKGGNTPVVVPAITTLDVSSGLARDDATDPNKNFPPPIVFPASPAVAKTEENVGSAGASPIVAGGSCQASGPVAGSVGYGVAPPTPASSGAATPSAGAGWTQGPVAIVEDPQGQHLYVANLSSNNVTVLDPVSRTSAGADNGVVGLVPVGIAPTGLALSADGSTLYVHESIWVGEGTTLSLRQEIRFVATATLTETQLVAVSNDDALNLDFLTGRQLFQSAIDPAMSVPGGGVACASCHLEGGNDGNVWQFPFGPRKTPSLLGRKIEDTAPFHWDGTESDFTDFFFETIQQRMGGKGVSVAQAGQLETFMQSLEAPDNPFVQVGGFTAAQASGQALFDGKAGCIACHSGANFTDNSFHDVGTFVSVNPNGNPDDACRLDPAAGPCAGVVQNCVPAGANPANTVHGFNTPSLLGVVWAAPYLHDGSAATLQDRLLQNPGDIHGNTAALSADEVDDLVQYLQTL